MVGMFWFLDRASAQSDLAIRSEITSLRNRVDRLESEVRGISQRSEDRSRVPQRRSGTGVVNGETVGQSDPLFDRLSTLVIELKEEVRGLEKRVKTLEEETARRHR
jgi:polyhydroxyalkanoate synthesis regulator phasin